MAIVTKGSGGSIKFSGSGGRLYIPGSGGGGGNLTLTYDTQTFTMSPGNSHPYYMGDSVILASSAGAIPYSITVYKAPVYETTETFNGNLPVNLNTLNLEDGDDVVIHINNDISVEYYVRSDVLPPRSNQVGVPDEYTLGSPAPVVDIEYPVDTLTVAAEGTYPYLQGDSVTISSPNGALPYRFLNNNNEYVTGTLPLDLGALDPGVISAWGSEIRINNDNRRLLWVIEEPALPLTSPYYTEVPSDYISDVTINGVQIFDGQTKSYSSEVLSPVTLSTTNVNTAYSIVDSTSNPVSSGNLPFDLRNLTDGDTYTVTAAGKTFNVNMTALPSISGIAGKMFHLDASQAGTVARSGNDVLSWSDLSAEENDATSILATGGSYPQYVTSSGGGVRFLSGSLAGMTSNAVPATGPNGMTMFLVTTLDSPSSYSSIIRYGTSSYFGIRDYNSGGGIGIDRGAGGYVLYDVDMQAGVPQVVAVRSDVTSIKVWDESGFDTMTDINVQLPANSHGITLCRPLPEGGAWYDAEYSFATIHEVLAYDSSLSDADVETIINRMKQKWGI